MNFSFRAFHEIQFQDHFMKYEILSWNNFILVSNIHCVRFSSIENTYTYNSDTAAGALFISSRRGVLKGFANFTGNHLCWGLFFYKVSSLQACINTKKRLLHRFFPVKFEKFWRALISKTIRAIAFVYWLLHHILIFTILYSTRFSFLQITSLLSN